MALNLGGRWVTINGRRVFIKEGQSLKSAMNESNKFNIAKEQAKKYTKLNNQQEQDKKTIQEKAKEQAEKYKNDKVTEKKNSKLTEEERKAKIEELEKLQKEYDSIQNMFDPRKAELRDKINALKEDKNLDDYKKEQKDKEIKQKADYLKEKQQRLSEEKEATRKENEKKYKDIKVKEINQEDLEKPKPGYTRLYRGLEQEFDKNYDRSSIDNPNGYESWTDNPNLAKAYGKNVYYMDVPTKDIGKNVMDNEGNRYMTYVHDKKVGIKGESGKEYMMYTDHDKYLKSTYTKIKRSKK